MRPQTKPGRSGRPGSVNCRFQAGSTTRYIPQKTQPFKSNLRRLNYLARGIHSLGPAALGYPFCDLAAGKSFWPTVEAYVALSPYRVFILANIGVRPVLRVPGGRAP